MKKLIKNLNNTIKYHIKKITHANQRLCRIAEINTLKNMIVIHCRGVNAPIKLTLDEAITDFLILSNLSPKHSAWIGYYYGKYYDDLIIKNIKKLPIATEFYLSVSNSAAFNISAISRKGEIIYRDRNNQEKIITPINALTRENIISQFDPIQACYIGILCGTSISKIPKIQSIKNTADLKLVT